MNERDRQRAVVIDYTDNTGSRAKRPVLPVKVWYGVTIHHPQPQWFLRALCLERKVDRDFALKDIASWAPLPAEEFQPRVCLPPEEGRA